MIFTRPKVPWRPLSKRRVLAMKRFGSRFMNTIKRRSQKVVLGSLIASVVLAFGGFLPASDGVDYAVEKMPPGLIARLAIRRTPP